MCDDTSRVDSVADVKMITLDTASATSDNARTDKDVVIALTAENDRLKSRVEELESFLKVFIDQVGGSQSSQHSSAKCQQKETSLPTFSINDRLVVPSPPPADSSSISMVVSPSTSLVASLTSALVNVSPSTSYDATAATAIIAPTTDISNVQTQLVDFTCHPAAMVTSSSSSSSSVEAADDDLALQRVSSMGWFGTRGIWCKCKVVASVMR
jgi:hypothetical protein